MTGHSDKKTLPITTFQTIYDNIGLTQQSMIPPIPTAVNRYLEDAADALHQFYTCSSSETEDLSTSITQKERSALIYKILYWRHS